MESPCNMPWTWIVFFQGIYMYMYLSTSICPPCNFACILTVRGWRGKLYQKDGTSRRGKGKGRHSTYWHPVATPRTATMLGKEGEEVWRGNKAEEEKGNVRTWTGRRKEGGKGREKEGGRKGTCNTYVSQYLAGWLNTVAMLDPVKLS